MNLATLAGLARLKGSAVALALLAGCAGAALAQRGDVIRGRVTAPDSSPIPNATVTARSLPDTTIRRARTDSTGAYSITFDGGSGRYAVSVAALGHAPQRLEVERQTSGTGPIVANFRLTPVAARLGAMVTRAQRRKPAPGDAASGPGTTATFLNLGNGLSGDVTGDLTAALGMIPGVTVTPDPNGGLPTINAFGMSDQAALLNGMAFGGGSLPRDGFRVSAVTNTYDPGVGGFTSALVNVTLPSGSNFPSRSLHYTEDDPTLQWTSPVANQLGGRYADRVLSGTASGPLSLDRLFYHLSYQFERRDQPLVSLPSASATSLQALGLSPDSAARLLSALAPLGIPLRTSGIPGDRQINAGSLFSRIDFRPDGSPDSNNPDFFSFGGPGFISFGGPGSGIDQYSVLAGGSWRGQGGMGIGPTALPADGIQSGHWDARLQGTGAKYFSFVLNEATVTTSASDDHSTPYLTLPNAQVLVNSSLTNGTPGFISLQAGGNAGGQSETRTAALEVKDEVSWYTWDQRHKLKITADATADHYAITQAATNGVFNYTSLGAFETGQPASFSRSLNGLSRGAHGLNGALAFGDVWSLSSPTQPRDPSAPPPMPWQLAYGVRLEGNELLTRPSFNPLVDSVTGLRTDRVPNTWALLPMIGFTKRIGVYEPSPGFKTSRGSITGGIREYRTTFATRNLDSYLRQTGLPSGLQQLYCVGSAVPVPDWSTFLQTDSLPTDCADGSAGTPLALSAPPVALLAPDFQPATSWRAPLNVDMTLTPRFRGNVGVTYAWNQHLGSTYDMNFNPTTRFTLADEGGRPVFVSPSSIVPQTGAVSYAESRNFSQFSHVSELRSDMVSEARQLTTGLSYQPSGFSFGNSTFWSLSVNYTYSDNHDRARGFTGTTAGDPRVPDWAPSATPRHRFQSQAFLVVPTWFNVNLLGSFQSGQPFTPRVNADILGDGYANARAFVFNPGTTTDTVVAAGMRNLLATAPGSIRDCLVRQLGAIAARNSCTPGWWSTLNFRVSPDAYRLHLGNRGNFSLIVTNALAAADRLVHGPNHLQGWGQPAYADATLLNVRGFDPTANRYLYTVNPNFGSAAVFRNTFGAPFRLTLDASVEVGPDRETVGLASYLRPRAVDNTDVLNQSQIRNRLLGNGGRSIVDQLLRSRDSIHLTQKQVDSINTLNATYLDARDTIYTELSKYLAARKGNYNGDEVREHWHQSLGQVAALRANLWRRLGDVLTPAQIDGLPFGMGQTFRIPPRQWDLESRRPQMFPP